MKFCISTISLITLLILSFPKANAYSTLKGEIIDNQGQVVNIDGVNWSGFQDSGFIDELYGAITFYPLTTGYSPVVFGLIDMLTHPWDNAATGVLQTNSVAFKTIRLPINPTNLHNDSINNHFRYDLTDTAHKEQGNGVFCQVWDSQHCTAGLSIKESLYQVIAEFKKQSINVLVDFHQTPVGRNGNVVEKNYSLNDYSNDVATLATEIKTRGLTNVIGIDVFNEPHNLKWFQASGDQPAWVSVIQTAGLAIYQNNPDLLLFVEGTNTTAALPICFANDKTPPTPQDPIAYKIISHSPNCSASYPNEVTFVTNWGENFQDLLNVTEALRGNPLFDVDKFKNNVCQGQSTDFCVWLMSHLVFSPHVYGKAIASWETAPDESPYRFDWTFGFLQQAGFPVVMGESGYKPNTTDVSFFQQSVMPYLLAHQLRHHLFYWTWNSNSGDTGGVRRNADSIGLDITKEQDLYQLYGKRS